MRWSDRNDVFRLRAFLPSRDSKLDLLSVLKGFKSVALDCTEVDEYVGTAFLFDESVSLGFVKPLYGACYL